MQNNGSSDARNKKMETLFPDRWPAPYIMHAFGNSFVSGFRWTAFLTQLRSRPNPDVAQNRLNWNRTKQHTNSRFFTGEKIPARVAALCLWGGWCRWAQKNWHERSFLLAEIFFGRRGNFDPWPTGMQWNDTCSSWWQARFLGAVAYLTSDRSNFVIYDAVYM